jgi:hypothetical protein
VEVSGAFGPEPGDPPYAVAEGIAVEALAVACPDCPQVAELWSGLLAERTN